MTIATSCPLPFEYKSHGPFESGLGQLPEPAPRIVFVTSEVAPFSKTGGPGHGRKLCARALPLDRPLLEECDWLKESAHPLAWDA